MMTTYKHVKFTLLGLFIYTHTLTCPLQATQEPELDAVKARLKEAVKTEEVKKILEKKLLLNAPEAINQVPIIITKPGTYCVTQNLI